MIGKLASIVRCLLNETFNASFAPLSRCFVWDLMHFVQLSFKEKKVFRTWFNRMPGAELSGDCSPPSLETCHNFHRLIQVIIAGDLSRSTRAHEHRRAQRVNVISYRYDHTRAGARSWLRSFLVFAFSRSIDKRPYAYERNNCKLAPRSVRTSRVDRLIGSHWSIAESIINVIGKINRVLRNLTWVWHKNVRLLVPAAVTVVSSGIIVNIIFAALLYNSIY